MNLNIFEQFYNITNYDIELFFEKYNLFTSVHYPLILNYYNGGNMNQESFNSLDELKKGVEEVESLLDELDETLNTTDHWDMVDLISDIQNSLYKVDSLSRWLRSSRTNRYSENLKIDYVQKQNQSIENISSDLGFTEENSWVDLAVQNSIEEEGYTNKGGKFLKAILPNNSTFELDNIVDTLSQENIFGKDLNKRLEFISNDLSVLTGKESLNQTFSTTMSTIAGSIPEFPSDGVPDYIYGTNQNIIQYPIIFRSLLNMLQKDKRFTSFEILNIRKDQDSVFIDTETKSITGDTFIKELKI